MGEVITIHPGQQAPDWWDACVLVGSLPGPAAVAPGEVTAMLRQRWANDGRLAVFAPWPTGGSRAVPADDLLNWYDRAFDVADFAVFCWPEDADLRVLLASLAARDIGQRMVYGTPHTLADMVGTVLGKIGSGAHRAGGEREVPLAVWRTESFRRWYSAQTSAGNTLLGARQVWTFGNGAGGRVPLYWALHVRVHVRAENRVKANEVVISRPDISAVVLYRPGAGVDDTTIVLVREFRSPASTPDGLVHELPGGSGAAGTGPLDQAAAETAEETGLVIDARRMRAHGSRQLAGTMSAHHAHLFSAEISGTELARLRATRSTPHGIGEEQNWTEITTFGEIRRDHLVDWATLGMIAQVVLDGNPGQPAAAAGVTGQA